MEGLPEKEVEVRIPSRTPKPNPDRPAAWVREPTNSRASTYGRYSGPARGLLSRTLFEARPAQWGRGLVSPLRRRSRCHRVSTNCTLVRIHSEEVRRRTTANLLALRRWERMLERIAGLGLRDSPAFRQSQRTCPLARP